MFPKPIAEPTAAIIKPALLPNVSLFIHYPPVRIYSCHLIGYASTFFLYFFSLMYVASICRESEFILEGLWKQCGELYPSIALEAPKVIHNTHVFVQCPVGVVEGTYSRKEAPEVITVAINLVIRGGGHDLKPHLPEYPYTTGHMVG